MANSFDDLKASELWDFENDRPRAFLGLSPWIDNETQAQIALRLKQETPMADATQAINGWAPPIMYDIRTDETQLVTQADADEFVAMIAAHGDMIRLAREIIERHDSLRAQVIRLRNDEG